MESHSEWDIESLNSIIHGWLVNQLLYSWPMAMIIVFLTCLSKLGTSYKNFCLCMILYLTLFSLFLRLFYSEAWTYIRSICVNTCLPGEEKLVKILDLPLITWISNMAISWALSCKHRKYVQTLFWSYISSANTFNTNSFLKCLFITLMFKITVFLYTHYTHCKICNSFSERNIILLLYKEILIFYNRPRWSWG